MPSLLTLLKLLVLFAPISSFVLTPRASILLAPLHRPHRLHLLPEPEKGDKIDWDADWQRVVRGEIKPTEPGISPPSDLEKTLRKAKASVQAKTKDIPKTLPKFEMLKQSEWQFWVGLILVVSLGTSFLDAITQNGMTHDNSQYFSDLNPNGRI